MKFLFFQIILILPLSLQAQPQNVEKLQVTGSHIKRVDVEGPSPVMTLDRETLEKSGYNSVSDVLRDSTISSFGALRESSDEISSRGASNVGLRGFGADKVLVLLNGRRLPKIGGANTVDLNLIPFEAIDRIEILKDGASAIYGSDALAGVINLIMKKDYDGANFNMRYSQPEKIGGTRQDISAVYGKNFSKGNFLAVYQYRNNERVWDRDRQWSRGFFSSYGSPGSIKEISKKDAMYRPMGNCPRDRVIGDEGKDQFCGFDFTPFSTSLPDTEQHNVMASAEYEISDNLTVFANQTYTRRENRFQMAPSADDFAYNKALGKDFTLSKDVAQKAGLTGASGPVELRYRSVELGPRSNRETTNSFGTVVGTKGYFSDTWDWEASANYGFSEVYGVGVGGYGDRDKMLQAMKNGVWKPLTEGNTGDLSSARHQGEQWVRSELTSTQFIASGELGSALGGLVTMAAGTSAAWESYDMEVDEVTAQGRYFGGIGEEGQGSRNFQSVFSELGLAYEKLEFNFAGRVDNYSDFGSTFNPKFAFRYKPLGLLMVRGSVGTGFRAPSLRELYGAKGYQYPTFRDPIAAAQVGGIFKDAVQHKVFTGGNPNLQEETSFSYNLGTVIQPTRNFEITTDYWVTQIDNAVGMDFNDLMVAEQTFGNQGIKKFGVEVVRNNGIISEVYAPNLNLAKQISQGVDLSVAQVIRTGPVTIRPVVHHSILLRRDEEIFPGLRMRSKLGEAGRPRWRNTAVVSINRKNQGLRLAARTIAGQYKVAHLDDPTYRGRLPTYTEYDAHYDYDNFFDGRVSIGVKNLLGSTPPTDFSGGFADRMNPSLYDIIGRMYYMGYSRTF